MTIAPIVAEAWKQMRPPRKKHVRQEHKRCVICTIVVDEAVIVKGEEQWEGFVKTDDGLVCDVCARGEQVEAQRVRAVIQKKHRAIADAQKRARGGQLTDIQRAKRNVEIMRLHALDWSYQRIANKVGMSGGGVGSVVRLERRRACT